VSPTGSKTGHPFLANGPRRSTRVGEPSRRLKVTHPTRLLRDVLGQHSCRSKTVRRWRSSVPSSFSLRAPHCRQRGFEYGAGVPVRNSVSRRRLPVSAFTFQPHQPPTPILSNRVRLEATNVPPAPRRETAAWQPRCFPPLGIDVHGARAHCVHRQVLRPRRRPFDRVPLPLEEGEFAFAVRRGRAFFYLTLLPYFDCVEQYLQLEGPLRSTVSTCSRVNFLVGVVTASCGSVVPDKSSKGACAPPDAGLEPGG
jgi:hypothetical protein